MDPAWVTRDEVVSPMGYRSNGGATLLMTVVRIDLRALPAEPLPSLDASVSADAGADAGP
jgi:hypothetical protein